MASRTLIRWHRIFWLGRCLSANQTGRNQPGHYKHANSLDQVSHDAFGFSLLTTQDHSNGVLIVGLLSGLSQSVARKRANSPTI